MSFAVPRSNRRTSGVGDYEQTDVARNIGSVLRFGKVSEVDFENRLCRVELNNGVITDYIPWITIRAGGNVHWSAPSIDEVVLVLSPSGEINNAVVLPAMQSNANGTWPFNFDDLEFVWGGLGEPRDALWRWLFADGAILENDPTAHQFRVEQQNTRLMGKTVFHAKSDHYIYIDADNECATVHVKAPFIKLEGDVQITGQLLQGGRIVGTEPDGEGLKDLTLVGDPIKLNPGGGILSLAASLITSFAGAGFSLGTLGSILGNFGGSITQGLTGLASNVLGQSGMSALIGGLAESGIGAAISQVGALPVLGEVFNAAGFVGNVLTGQGGITQLVAGVTSGTGLDLTGTFQGLSGLSSAIGTAFNVPALSNLTDNAALGAIANVITTGDLTINDVMEVANGAIQVSGYTPPAGINNAINTAMAATAAVVDGNGNTVAGTNITQRDPADIMAGLRDPISRITDSQIADVIGQRGLATPLQGLLESGDKGGQIIGQFISDGAVSLEQVLDMSSVFLHGTDPRANAHPGAGGGGGDTFFKHFNRSDYEPEDSDCKDMSDKSGSHTDNRVTQEVDAWGDFGTNVYPDIA